MADLEKNNDRKNINVKKNKSKNGFYFTIGIAIICGISGLILASIILNIDGQAGDFGIILFGVIGFFSPGLYILNKPYEKLLRIAP